MTKKESMNVNAKSLSVKLQRLLMVMAAIMMALVTFSACEKDENGDKDENGSGDEKPGQISGFGDNTGKISGKTFELPNGIVFDGDILGASWESITTHSFEIKSEKLSYNYTTLLNEMTTRSVISDYYKYDMYGSGVNVLILLRLKNTTSRQIDVEFPAGLVFESSNAKYQHGILIKKTKVSVPAEGNDVILMMYCGNAKRDMPGTSVKFLKPVVTNSNLLLSLCDLVKNKRINVEENMESNDEMGNYFEITYKLQEIVWKVTDYGQKPDKADLDYIAGISNSQF